MPIDPNIILAAGSVGPKFRVQPTDPLEQYGKALALQNMQQQGDEQRNSIESNQRLRALFQNNPKATSDDVMGVDPKTGMALRKQELEGRAHDATIGKDNAAADKSRFEVEMLRLSHGATLLDKVTDPQSFTAAMTRGAQLGIFKPETAQKALEMGYSPDLVEQIKAMGTTRAQQLEAQNRAATLAETARGHDLTNAATTRGQDMTAATARAARAQTESHFQAGQAAPQYMETDAGLVALPKRPQAGAPIVGTPVMGPTGEPLSKPLKPLPPAVNDAVIGNAQSLYSLDKAINLLQGKNVDSAKGDSAATGWKGYLPQAVLNRIDESGVDTRAEVADIGSMKIHDRSGAAVTVSESPRLMPFIPLTTDPAGVAIRKLTRLKEEVKRMQQGLSDTYSKDQGYKPSPISARAAPAPAAAAPSRVNSLSEADPAKFSGQVATGDDGTKYKSDGKRWVRVP